MGRPSCFPAQVVAAPRARRGQPHASRAVPALLALAAGAFAQTGAILQIGDDARVSRLVALHLPAGSAPGSAVWRGTIEIALRDKFTFHVEGNGELTLAIAGEKVPLDAPTKLTKGKNPFTATWKPPASGDAWIRLYWECSEWAREPVPPKVLGHDPNDALLKRSSELRRGRDLFVQLRCIKCHEHECALPERGYDAPSLSDIAPRMSAEWIARYTVDPKAMRPTARMPALLHGDTAPSDARDIAAFLHSMGDRPAPDATPAPTDAQVQAGAKAFQSLGCFNCHTPPDVATLDAERIPLHMVGAKYRPDALVAFLKEPARFHSGTRMPDFGLTQGEATELAAFLRAKGAPPLPVGETGDAKRGRELAITHGCAKCHFGCGEMREVATPPLAKLLPDRDCTTARHALAPEQAQALRAFLASDRGSLTRDTRAEFAERQFEELRCFACHARDRQQDLWSTLATESTETVVGAARPALTWAGEKLRPEWTTKLLSGEVKPRTRPWLNARMPSWRLRAQPLAKGLAASHGFPPVSPAQQAPDPALVTLGKQIVGSSNGFTCVQCHALGEQKAQQTFEVEGINFVHAHERLTREYFLRWMQNPMRIDLGTKMPKYADKTGKTGLTQVLEGDAAKQYDAIWQFLQSLR